MAYRTATALLGILAVFSAVSPCVAENSDFCVVGGTKISPDMPKGSACCRGLVALSQATEKVQPHSCIRNRAMDTMFLAFLLAVFQQNMDFCEKRDV